MVTVGPRIKPEIDPEVDLRRNQFHGTANRRQSHRTEKNGVSSADGFPGLRRNGVPAIAIGSAPAGRMS